ncbi:MAG: hypothetical protein WBD09_01625 [Halobacteriota archaeon]
MAFVPTDNENEAHFICMVKVKLSRLKRKIKEKQQKLNVRRDRGEGRWKDWLRGLRRGSN